MDEEKQRGSSSGVIVLIPTYNEVDNIETLIHCLENQGHIQWIQIVDDSSTDGTLETLVTLQEEYDNLFVHQRPELLGLGAALKDGFHLALENFPFRRLIQMDGDLSHNPNDIPTMLLSGANMVIGSRYVQGSRITGWSTYRKLLSRGANFFARTLLGLRAHDVTSGFRIYSRRAVEIIATEGNRKGYEFQVEAVWLAEKWRLDIEEVPITFTERLRGKSKLRDLSEVNRLVTFVLKQAVMRAHSHQIFSKRHSL